MSSPPIWAEVAGWYGTVAILAAYAANSRGLLDPNNPRQRWVYQGLNLTGAVGVAVVSAFHQNWQPVALNGIWAVIALSALIRPTAPPEAERGASD